MKKKILVLGCTGSIGSQTLDIARNMKDSFEVVGISAGHNEKSVQELCKEFNCRGTVFSRDGIDGLEKLIKECNADIAVNGIAGSAGLIPSTLIIENGTDLALANKETVVMAWPVIKVLAEKHNANIVPVDSEHSAIFNLTQKIGCKNISEIVITASGGPFREYTKEELKKVTLKDALKHPTWNMGPKITVDSASLANKGLEVIEAVRLFNTPAENVKVVIHPQSLIHSLVRTKDGMLYAQISNPDMRHPIFGALVWPEYKENYLEPFNLFDNSMTFFKPRMEAFPLLSYAYECARKGTSYTIAFNAANEVAVDAFMKDRIGFTEIFDVVNNTLQSDWTFLPEDIDSVMKMDLKARKTAESFVEKILK